MRDALRSLVQIVTGSGKTYLACASSYRLIKFAAVTIISSQPAIANDTVALWERIMGQTKSHNSQMDVVAALWRAGLIVF